MPGFFIPLPTFGIVEIYGLLIALINAPKVKTRPAKPVPVGSYAINII